MQYEIYNMKSFGKRNIKFYLQQEIRKFQNSVLVHLIESCLLRISYYMFRTGEGHSRIGICQGKYPEILDISTCTNIQLTNPYHPFPPRDPPVQHLHFIFHIHPHFIFHIHPHFILHITSKFHITYYISRITYYKLQITYYTLHIENFISHITYDICI